MRDTARSPAYPARSPAYPARSPAYPARSPAYPARSPAYPAHLAVRVSPPQVAERLAAQSPKALDALQALGVALEPAPA
jgi:DNA-directed RNA polymerase II subunit RPB1